MSRKGLVLSDGDVGVYNKVPLTRQTRKLDLIRSDEVEIRLPNLKGKGFQSYKARVIRRDRQVIDSPSGMARHHVPSSVRRPMSLSTVRCSRLRDARCMSARRAVVPSSIQRWAINSGARTRASTKPKRYPVAASAGSAPETAIPLSCDTTKPTNAAIAAPIRPAFGRR